MCKRTNKVISLKRFMGHILSNKYTICHYLHKLNFAKVGTLSREKLEYGKIVRFAKILNEFGLLKEIGNIYKEGIHCASTNIPFVFSWKEKENIVGREISGLDRV